MLKRHMVFEKLCSLLLLCGDVIDAFQPGIVDAPSQDGTSPSIDLRALPLDSDCVTPYHVGGAGDFNGDGYDDLVFGGEEGSLYAAYVVYGNPHGRVPDLDSLDGDNGFGVLASGKEIGLGVAVDALGDVNGDGLDDIAIGDPTADGSDRYMAGEVVVLFGAADGPKDVDLTKLDGREGFVIRGANSFDQLGYETHGAGDVNGDGLSDIILGVPLASNDGQTGAGGAYIVFGQDEYPPTLDLNLLDDSVGVRITEDLASNWLGLSVAGIGDINNDGLDDVAVGSRGYVANETLGNGLGYAMVIFGNHSLPSSISPADLNGTNGFLFQQRGALTNVSAAGDFNADGFDDVAFADDVFADGSVYILFGSETPFDSLIPAIRNPELFDGSFGVRITGYLGGQLAGVGDFNGDGASELLAGRSFNADVELDNQVHLLFGSEMYPSLSVTRTMDDLLGISIRNTIDITVNEELGAVGDFNGDGLDDIVVNSGRLGYLLLGTRELNGTVSVEPQRGDVDRNGKVDARDIDALMLTIRTGGLNPAYDVLIDGRIDDQDIDALVTEILQTRRGDANLDGVVSFADFLALSAHFGRPSSWAQGDFNGDGIVSFDDFLILSTNYNRDL